MNRRKFLTGIAALAAAGPAVVAGVAVTGKLKQRAVFDASSYLTSNTAWYLKDYPRGMDDWSERGRRYHEALQRSMAMTSDQFRDKACAILNDSFTEVYGSSGL